MDSNLKTPSKIIVKSSPIHGTGLFAIKLTRKGEIVVDWENTKEIIPEEFSRLPPGECSRKHSPVVQQ
jgi:hypothetical protein